jgi:preprotein translocase subunit SecY
MATTATTAAASTARRGAARDSRRSVASRHAHRGGGRATTASAARDDDVLTMVNVGRRTRVHRARRARTRAASDEEIQRIREQMYDFDDGEIGLEAFGRAGGATTTSALGGAVRFAQSSIFQRIVSVLAMMVFVRGGMLLPSRFFETTVGSGSPFSMTSLMSTFAGGGGGGVDAVMKALMGGASSQTAAAAAETTTNWLVDSLSTGGVPWFHIGIGPYIGASIAMSVLTAFSPELQAMRKDQTGQETIKWWTRLMTFTIAVIQSVVEAGSLKAYSVIGTGFWYYLTVVPMLVTGALAITWVADEITDYGLGQGSSVIITMSICGGYFSALKALLPSLLANFSLQAAAPVIGFFAILMLGTVLLEQGTVKVRLEYFQGPSGSVGLPKSMQSGEENHIPFKINPTNMQPVIFSMFLLSALQWLPFGFLSWINGASVGYFFLLFTLVFLGTFIDLQNTPQDISEYMMKIGARVPGVRPGTQTVDHFSQVQAGSRFFGGVLLATIATLCSLIDAWMSKTCGQSFGLMSMLIVVSTIVGVKRQIQAMSQMPELDKVLKTM